MNTKAPIIVFALLLAALFCPPRGTGQSTRNSAQSNTNTEKELRKAVQSNSNAAQKNSNTMQKMPGVLKTPRRKTPSAPFVVFAVSKYETNVTIEPIVIFNRGAFVKPPIDEEVASKTFVNEYFKAGRKYRLLSGGGEAGTATVVKYEEPGCVGLVAEASVQTQAHLGGQVQALATSSETLGNRPSSRRAPTDLERILAREQARAAFTKSGLGASLTNSMEIVNLTATDLDGDGNFELIGSFKIDKIKNRPGDSYNLFIIFEHENDITKPALTWLHHGGEVNAEERSLVDQVDFDGDGQAEVIVEGHYYESNDYIIYKKQQGQWRSVYQGGGGGC
jgi:hypothetical protein